MRIRYTIKYKPPGLFARWRVHKDVVADGFEKEVGLKFLELADGSLIFYHCSYETIYSKERRQSVVEAMSKQAGQPVQEA